jgi:hypothetical protein
VVQKKKNYVTNYFDEANKERSILRDLNFCETHEPEQILRTLVLITLNECQKKSTDRLFRINTSLPSSQSKSRPSKKSA